MSADLVWWCDKCRKRVGLPDVEGNIACLAAGHNPTNYRRLIPALAAELRAAIPRVVHGEWLAPCGLDADGLFHAEVMAIRMVRPISRWDRIAALNKAARKLEGE